MLLQRALGCSSRCLLLAAGWGGGGRRGRGLKPLQLFECSVDICCIAAAWNLSIKLATRKAIWFPDSRGIRPQTLGAFTEAYYQSLLSEVCAPAKIEALVQSMLIPAGQSRVRSLFSEGKILIMWAFPLFNPSLLEQKSSAAHLLLGFLA